MRTKQQAVDEEMRRYLAAIEAHKPRLAHIRRLALDRVRFPYQNTATSTPGVTE